MSNPSLLIRGGLGMGGMQQQQQQQQSGTAVAPVAVAPVAVAPVAVHGAHHVPVVTGAATITDLTGYG